MSGELREGVAVFDIVEESPAKADLELLHLLLGHLCFVFKVFVDR